ncbi:MAG: sterol desaturase family protein [Epsilonproteobacteria bacterium]|nr:sterol desaturase family protein [Campylobacterota bacterium]
MEISSYFFDTNQRVYWLYMLSSLLIALYYVWQTPKLRAYFSKAVLWHPSARLDYLYFAISALLKALVILPLLVGANEVAMVCLNLMYAIFGHFSHAAWSYESVVALYTLSIFIAGDFTRYWLHRWLHSVAFLWRFHRVHHSAEVLNPLTFYRVHPFEHILFGVRHALSVGVMSAVFLYFFGAKVGTAEFLGANIFVFIFGMLGANLRHSHIPVRYGIFEKLLVSPYMHQLHHTKEYGHKNFGGVLSIWDRMFGSWHVNMSDEALHYGLREGNPHTTLRSIFMEPFVFSKNRVFRSFSE